MKKRALEHFRKPPQRLNCAQSVLYAYQQAGGKTPLSLEELKPLGGGRAPGGLCGALHTACTLAPENADRFKTNFAKITGSILCREMRAANVYPCEVCVSEAASLLESELGQGGGRTQ